MEGTRPGGLVVVEHRTASNGVERADAPPGSVGPDYHPGEEGAFIYDPPPPPRAMPWDGWPAGWSTPNWRGAVNQLTDTAFAAIDLNASVLASMPPYLVGASPSLNAEWTNNPDPDRYASWYDFEKDYAWNYQLGEAYILATARYDNGNGYPARFHVVPPWMVDAELTGDGRRRFGIGGRDVTADLLAVRYVSNTIDARGHGPLEAGSMRVVAAQALARFATNMAVSGGVPAVMVKSKRSMNDQQALDLQTKWVQARTSAMGLPVVVSGDLEVDILSFNPKDIGLLDLANFNETRIATLLGVPAAILNLPGNGDSLTYSTAQMAREQHWQGGLKPKATAMMQALSNWALPRGTNVELNRDAYISPGLGERAQAWSILIGLGVFSVEQVQSIERANLAGSLASGAQL